MGLPPPCLSPLDRGDSTQFYEYVKNYQAVHFKA